MLFKTLALLSFFTASVVAAPHQKRLDTTDLISSFNTLTAQFQSAGSDLSSALSGVDLTDASAFASAAEPILTSIDSDVKALASNLAITKRSITLETRQDLNLTAIADAIAAALEALVTALQPILTELESLPIIGTLLGPFLSDLDVDLGIVLAGVGLVLDGVLALVSDLLSDLGSALSGLGLTSVLGSLGL